MTQFSPFQLNLNPDHWKALYIGLCYLYKGENTTLKEFFESWQSDFLEEVAIRDFEHFQYIIEYLVNEVVGNKGVMFLMDVYELQQLRAKLADFGVPVHNMNETFIAYIKEKYSMIYLMQVTKFTNLHDLETNHDPSNIYEVALLELIKEKPEEFKSILKSQDYN